MRCTGVARARQYDNDQRLVKLHTRTKFGPDRSRIVDLYTLQTDTQTESIKIYNRLADEPVVDRAVYVVIVFLLVVEQFQWHT